MKQWQEECGYLGRHVSFVPAQFANGYQYKPFANPGQVQRAIPVDGNVTDPFYYCPTPQVTLRLCQQKSNAQILGEKIRRLFKGRWNR